MISQRKTKQNPKERTQEKQRFYRIYLRISILQRCGTQAAKTDLERLKTLEIYPKQDWKTQTVEIMSSRQEFQQEEQHDEQDPEQKTSYPMFRFQKDAFVHTCNRLLESTQFKDEDFKYNEKLLKNFLHSIIYQEEPLLDKYL